MRHYERSSGRGAPPPRGVRVCAGERGGAQTIMQIKGPCIDVPLPLPMPRYPPTPPQGPPPALGRPMVRTSQPLGKKTRVLRHEGDVQQLQAGQVLPSCCAWQGYKVTRQGQRGRISSSQHSHRTIGAQLVLDLRLDVLQRRWLRCQEVADCLCTATRRSMKATTGKRKRGALCERSSERVRMRLGEGKREGQDKREGSRERGES